MPTIPVLVLRTALTYFAGIFALGFVLGTARVLWIAPALGAVAAVAIELPFILVASWLLARRLTRRPVFARPALRAAMGAVAFAVLMFAELALGVAAFGQTAQQWYASLGTAAGALGLAGQVLFAVMPLAARRAP